MSIHKSLAVNSALSRSRNVFTRAERIKKLAEQGNWSEGDSIYGLQKVKTRVKLRKSKKEKKKEAAEAAREETGGKKK